MRTFDLSPREISTVNGPHNLEAVDFYFREYLNKGGWEKQVPLWLEEDRLFALDGNHLCFVARAIGVNVKAVLLEAEPDFGALKKKDREAVLYQSDLLEMRNAFVVDETVLGCNPAAGKFRCSAYDDEIESQDTWSITDSMIGLFEQYEHDLMKSDLSYVGVSDRTWKIINGTQGGNT